jgi:hypothetical protein
MQQGLYHCIFDELPYDWQVLWDWYQRHQHLAVYFNDWMNARIPEGGTKFRGSGAGFKTLDLDGQLGRIVRDEPEINQLLRRWAFYQDLRAFDVDIMIYPKNYTLKAHTDHYMGCGIMYPIMPQQPSGIDFYRTPPDQQLTKATEYHVDVERDLIYTYNYLRGYPSMFNGQVIHGVRNGAEERIFLRVKLRNETFQSIIERAEKNLLFTADM